MAENHVGQDLRQLVGYQGKSIPFMKKIFEVLENYLQEATKRSSKVVDFKQPEELERELDVSISDEGQSPDDVVSLCEKVGRLTMHSSHPMFMNQLYGQSHPYAQAAAYLEETINTNAHTYEAGNVFVTVEKYLIKELGKLVGYGDNVDGIFMPGGALTNVKAMHVARYTHAPESFSEGMYNRKRLIAYTSEEAHYSTQRGAVFLGLGSDNVVNVKTDEEGRMCPQDLETKIKESLALGHQPFYVVATMGTTVIGAFDPISKLADICDKYNLWLHADCSWGCGAFFAESLKHNMKGIERSKSIAFSFHKIMHSALHTNVTLVHDKDLLEKSLSGKVDYLFHPDKHYDMSYDIGKKSIQCGRKGDALKLWIMWKCLGHKGMSAQIEHHRRMALMFANKIRDRKGFRLINKNPIYTNVCFWYIPPSLRNMEETIEWWDKVAKVGPYIKERMMASGSMMIGYTPLESKGYVNFWRVIFTQPEHTESDLDYIINEIETLGKDFPN